MLHKFDTNGESVTDYNQLKVKILGLFNLLDELDSGQVLMLVSNLTSAGHRDKAIEMALLRYWRQGLLKRIRRQGRFYYSITDRGVGRREWLLKTNPTSEA